MGKSFKNNAAYQAMSYVEKIDFCASQSNLISVNNGNSKTGKGCLTLSVPTITCAPDAPCRKGCYCIHLYPCNALCKEELHVQYHFH